MSGVVSSIFGGAQSAPGPDPELVAAQQRQQERLDEQAAREEEQLASRQRLLEGRQGRRGAATLFEGTGEAGVKAETLGG